MVHHKKLNSSPSLYCEAYVHEGKVNNNAIERSRDF